MGNVQPTARLQHLVSQGFSVAESRRALEAANNDLEAAQNMMLRRRGCFHSTGASMTGNSMSVSPLLASQGRMTMSEPDIEAPADATSSTRLNGPTRSEAVAHMHILARKRRAKEQRTAQAMEAVRYQMAVSLLNGLYTMLSERQRGSWTLNGASLLSLVRRLAVHWSGCVNALTPHAQQLRIRRAVARNMAFDPAIEDTLQVWVELYKFQIDLLGRWPARAAYCVLMVLIAAFVTVWTVVIFPLGFFVALVPYAALLLVAWACHAFVLVACHEVVFMALSMLGLNAFSIAAHTQLGKVPLDDAHHGGVRAVARLFSQPATMRKYRDYCAAQGRGVAFALLQNSVVWYVVLQIDGVAPNKNVFNFVVEHYFGTWLVRLYLCAAAAHFVAACARAHAAPSPRKIELCLRDLSVFYVTTTQPPPPRGGSQPPSPTSTRRAQTSPTSSPQPQPPPSRQPPQSPPPQSSSPLPPQSPPPPPSPPRVQERRVALVDVLCAFVKEEGLARRRMSSEIASAEEHGKGGGGDGGGVGTFAAAFAAAAVVVRAPLAASASAALSHDAEATPLPVDGGGDGGDDGGGDDATHHASGERMGTSALVTGRATRAALGVSSFLGLPSRELWSGMGRGMEAMVAEITASGTAEDRQCLFYILHQKVGSLQKKWAHSGGLVMDAFSDAAAAAADGRAGQMIGYFVDHPSAIKAELLPEHVVALRLYTTAAYRSINVPLRDAGSSGSGRAKPHPWPVTVSYLADGIRKLRAVEADAPDCMENRDYWRGMRDVRITDCFRADGGSEFAPMSTSSDLHVALRYSDRAASRLLFKVLTHSFIERGADLRFLSAFPDEVEYLYPPLTFLQPTGREDAVTIGDVNYSIVEVVPHFAS